MCSREMNVYEEVSALDIDQSVKERILNKVKRDTSDMSDLSEGLRKSYREIQTLRKAVIALSKLIGGYEENYDE